MQGRDTYRLESRAASTKVASSARLVREHTLAAHIPRAIAPEQGAEGEFLPSCGSQEKAAITQFTHYGGREAGKDLEIYGDELNWPPLQAPPSGCTLEEFAASQASPKQVVEYYEKILSKHGWAATVEWYPADGEGLAEYSVVGNRDGLRYDVYSFALDPDYEPADIRVNVYKP